MTDSCVLPEFTDNEAGLAANRLFGVSGDVYRLDGERDLNFRIDDADGPVVFKIANVQESGAMLECQQQVFDRIAGSGGDVQCPRGIASINGKPVEVLESSSGDQHYCRAVSFMPGTLLSAVNPHSPKLLENLGVAVAEISIAIRDFSHGAIQRPLLWQMEDAPYTMERFKGFVADPDRCEIVSYFEDRFREIVVPRSDQLRVGTIHNDANDNNVLVDAGDPWRQPVTGLIDYGDMVHSWLVVEPAVAAAYAALSKDRPLDAALSVISGFDSKSRLDEVEISVLFELICMRLCLSVCISAYQQSLDPENSYLAISEKPAWRALELFRGLSPEFAHFALRDACGLEPVPENISLCKWLDENTGKFEPIVSFDADPDRMLVLDTSVAGPALPNSEQHYDPEIATREVFRAIEDSNCIAGLGRYLEYRLIYSGDDFMDSTGHRRTLHLGIDIFMAKGTVVYAPLDGCVLGAANNDSSLDYGGTLILEHNVIDHSGESIRFFSLYGHLSLESISAHKRGDEILSGQKIAEMGDISENGNWPPHVHFQVMSNMLGESTTFVGVGSHQFRNVWKSLCPDPNLVLGITHPGLNSGFVDPDQICREILADRNRNLGPSLSVSYRQPLHIVRGGMQYLYDFTGRRYLDAVNNVAHIGHCHPRVVAAESDQGRVLNTNTRYLHSAIQRYSERLLSKFPTSLEVCFLVNSGSEANDLALRLARTFTGSHEIAVLDHAYHGNLSSLIDISPYKHDGNGGSGTPGYVHKLEIPDLYRGKWRRDTSDAADRYAQRAVDGISSTDEQSGPVTFIAESIPGCGGQILLPHGYLEKVYAGVRQQRGLCIADEVQVGFGRVGSYFWAFETQGVVPDIVTLGKPIGNGHPLAAVITTREIADAFNNGMEYFNTFGGNPISCAIGEAVLDVIEEEKLQHNAQQTGGYLLDALSVQKDNFEIIGDVRGMGLFLGVELVNDHHTLDPAASQAIYIAERMQQLGVLISTDGPFHNVLKIKPPMCFNVENADFLVAMLETVLKENFAQPQRH